ncbi:hypothetical protein T440DRAFT_555754 [Plenodomus tracheiphilus IPT5]|uniref:Uncharacterized protein n=1 Tax=Plenodomus tracheiphilus IPT5 TaxID=1408161 RepID=A0A6A7B2P1_9PLEO|nr:hypothetical protein T440DRAFT_555754 [Plenodomus tracheiphilus IPT5]
MAQPPSSMNTEPRRHKRTCCTPLWEYIKMIIRPKANPEDLYFEYAGSNGSTAWDHTVPQTPTASLDLDTKENRSGRSITQEIYLRLSLEAKTRELWDKYEELARQKSIGQRHPEDTSEEDNKFSAKETAHDTHPLPRSKELKAFPNVTTNCGLGRTKCNQVNGIIKTSHFIFGIEVPEVFEEEREDVWFCVADDGSVRLTKIDASMA